MATQAVKVPDIGDSESVEIIEVLVAAGDEVEAEQPLITLESDKATLEVPAPQAGTISAMKVGEGDTVSEGDVIAEMEPAESGGGDSDDSENADDQQDAPDEAGESATTDNADGGQDGSSTSGSGSDDGGSSDDSGGGEQAPIKVPDIGDSESVEVIEVLVSAGDEVEAEQPLITLESDKATLEVPAPAAGRIVEMTVSEGDKVSQGDVIGTLEQQDSGLGTRDSDEGRDSGLGTRDSGEDRDSGSGTRDSGEAAKQGTEASSGATEEDSGSDESKPRQSSPESRVPSPDQPVPSPESRHDARADSSSKGSKLDNVDEQGFLKAHASPSVRRYARKLGADLGQIEGSGRKGRILEEDVENYVKKALSTGSTGQAGSSGGAGSGLPSQPDIDFSQFGDTEVSELSRIRKISAKAVHNNWLMIPHVTQFESADITELEQFRQANKEAAKAEGVKLTPLAFLLKAAAAALKAFPDLNSSLTADGEHLVHKHYVNIAVAVDTPSGLMMPVIRDCDQKGIYQLARDLDEVSGRARDGKIKGDDMKGACFSISSLGGVGGSAFTPIVNSPEVGILGVSKHDWQPVWQDGEFVPRLMLPLSFSYDHRVIDGAEAARITNFFSRTLGDLRTLLL